MNHMSDAQFAATHAKLASQGGFTVNPRTGADITSGISVAPRGNEHREPLASSSPGALQDYAASNVHRWVSSPETGFHNASLGGWRSEGHDVLDTPTVYKNTPGGQTAARKNMVLSDQEAGFHLDTFQEIHNPFHPMGRQAMGLGGHELADLGTGSRERSEWQMQQPEVQAWVNQPRQSAAWSAEQKSSGSAPRSKKGRGR